MEERPCRHVGFLHCDDKFTSRAFDTKGEATTAGEKVNVFHHPSILTYRSDKSPGDCLVAWPQGTFTRRELVERGASEPVIAVKASDAQERRAFKGPFVGRLTKLFPQTSLVARDSSKRA
ncbi:hypothetical protein GCM10027405_20670 [Arthrobacter alkaliphilus]